MAETETVEEATSPEEPAKPEKHRRPIIPALIFLAIIGGAAYAFIIRSKPEQAIVRLIDYQLKLSEAGLGDQLYDNTVSQTYKKTCARDDFIGAIQQTPADFWKLTRYKNLHIKVEGNRAVVTYLITYNGVVTERATDADPDIYTLAPKTILGRFVTVREQLALIERLNHLATGGSFYSTPKEYEDAKKKARKEGDHHLIIEKAGQWYDAPDSHSGCGG